MVDPEDEAFWADRMSPQPQPWRPWSKANDSCELEEHVPGQAASAIHLRA